MALKTPIKLSPAEPGADEIGKGNREKNVMRLRSRKTTVRGEWKWIL